MTVSRHSRLLTALVVLGVVAVPAAAGTARSTEAAWVDRESAAGTLSSGVLNAPIGAGCDILNKKRFTARWTAAGAPSVSPQRFEYRLYWKAQGATEVLVVDWTSVGTALDLTYMMPSSVTTAGTYRFETRALTGSWTSLSATGTAAVIYTQNSATIDRCTWT